MSSTSTNQTNQTNQPASGSKALIFGGNQGIGRAITESFAAAGCHVAYASRKDVEAVPGFFIQTDLTDPNQGEESVNIAAKHLGGLDIVVFGPARFTPRTPIIDTPLDQVCLSLNINLVSAYSALAAAIPHLAQSKAGRFIAISSITGPRTGLPGMAHYGMAKAGLEGLVRTAALEVAALGITINAVEPGLIHTDTLQKNYEPQRIAAMDALVPGGSMGRPENIASAVSWLSSPAASFVNGTTITIDGAMTVVENP